MTIVSPRLIYGPGKQSDLEAQVNPRIALINMPFSNAERPSLALGLLKALAREAGWTADVHNFNLRFARRIGNKAYTFLCGASVKIGRAHV